jgi:hypothetical protein
MGHHRQRVEAVVVVWHDLQTDRRTRPLEEAWAVSAILFQTVAASVIAVAAVADRCSTAGCST